MPLYDYRCPEGHYFERLAPIAARQQQDCPVCGQPGGKLPSRVSLGGQASPGLAMEQMPQTWRGTYEGNPEYLGQLRRQWETRQKLEDRHEELRGDRRPILAHEGRYHGAPLRAGDPMAPTAPVAPEAQVPGAAPDPGAGEHRHAPGHSHAPGHGHGPGKASSPAHAPEPPTTL